MTVAATLLAFASCSKDDDGPSGKIDLKVQAVAPTTEDKVSDYSQFTVTVSSERDGKTMTESLDASGSATFNLDIGSYGIEIRGKENGKEYFGTTGMAQYGQSTTVSVDVENLSVHYTGNMDGIVLSELFYNGGTYGGTMMHPDQYIVIANNSDREINVSGLALAQASNMNTLPCSDLTSLLPDYVVAANIYQIPAGQNYTLAPGEVYVIASQAQNHTESYTPNPEKDTGIPVDLSGADFELADTHGDMVVERDELHVILEHIHDLLQVVRVPEREGKQHVIAVELRLFHRRHVDQLRQLQRNERHEVVIKVS